MKKRHLWWLIVASVVVCVTIMTVTVFAVGQKYSDGEWTMDDCIEIKDFIEENFDTFVREYNKSHEDTLEATGIEYWAIINSCDEEGMVYLYLDFDGDNGYFVGTGDYKVYELRTEGDHPVLRNNTNIWFDSREQESYGFYYLTEDGEFKNYNIFLKYMDYIPWWVEEIPE